MTLYAYICPVCGAHLDPGEKCDCLEKVALQEAEQDNWEEILFAEDDGQLKLAV